MSQALRKLTSVAAKTDSTILFINQIRQKIGVVLEIPRSQPEMLEVLCVHAFGSSANWSDQKA